MKFPNIHWILNHSPMASTNGQNKLPQLSGRHLGIYKSLLKDLPPWNPASPDHIQCTYSLEIMQYVFQLIKISLDHTHTYRRWKVIWNMYLEKDPGHPNITRLCSLHLIEANLNWILKWHFSKGFILWSEKSQCLHNSQYSGTPGQSTIDLACKKMVFNDKFHITWIQATNIFLDVALCFDWMIKSCQNMSCGQHGTNIQYLWLHAQTHQMFHYHIKHAHGMLEDYNSYTNKHPWYGARQGTADACPWWVVQADSLISAYDTVATPLILMTPDHSHSIKQGFDAFVNDTNIATATPPHSSNLINITQCNLNHWHNLLQASRGVLNPQKCIWMHFTWQYQKGNQHYPRNHKNWYHL